MGEVRRQKTRRFTATHLSLQRGLATREETLDALDVRLWQARGVVRGVVRGDMRGAFSTRLGCEKVWAARPRRKRPHASTRNFRNGPHYVSHNT